MLPDIFHTNRSIVFGTLTLTTDNSAFMIMELGSWRVWSINRGCLLFLGTWSHFQYIWGSVLAHLFLFVIPTCVLRLITLWYLSHFILVCVCCFLYMANDWAPGLPNSHSYITVLRVHIVFLKPCYEPGKSTVVGWNNSCYRKINVPHTSCITSAYMV
jgi:hypothetical protein